MSSDRTHASAGEVKAIGDNEERVGDIPSSLAGPLEKSEEILVLLVLGQPLLLAQLLRFAYLARELQQRTLTR